LRKYLIVAVAAFTVLSMAAVAVAQSQYPAPDPSSNVTVSPKKAGTKKKPKKVGLGLFIENNVESKTTASHIQIDLPSTMRIGAKGLAKCSEAAIEQAQSTRPCPRKSLVGEGVAHAILGPYTADPSELTLDVTAVNGGPKRVFFFVQVRDTSVVGLLDGRITKKNRRLTMSIPESLKKPDGFTYSALVDIDVDIERKSGVVRSTGCKARKHSIKTTLRFEANPTPPPVSTASTTDTVACSK
jgi:hypothetical protein